MKKPQIKEIAEWMGNQEQAILFYNYYESINWKVGKNSMQKWKSAATGWLKRNEGKVSKIDTAMTNPNAPVIDRIWLRMKQSFGEKFIREFGEVPTKPWIGMVSSLSNEEIAYGLVEVVRIGKDWPPSVGGFRRLCKSYRKPIKALNTPDRKAILHQRDRTQSARLNAMIQIREIL